MAQKVIIVGGGFAGLASAVLLVTKGYQVELFELRPFLGGRFYSFIDPETNDYVDNGQHVLTGFYYETFKLLNLLGTSEHIARQKRLAIDFYEKKGKIYPFSSPNLPSPFHLLFGLLKYSKFPKKDLINLILRGRKLFKEYGAISASEILYELGQSEESHYAFYRPLVLATLNADLHEVSGRIFQSMMKVILSVPASHSVLAYATVGFSELLAGPAAKIIQESGGQIHFTTPIKAVHTEVGRINGIVDQNGIEHKADHYIMALPPDVLGGILPEGSVPHIERWAYSPIVSVNIWYDRPVMDRMVAGFLDGKFHWCFDKASIVKEPDKHRYVTLLESSAYDNISVPKEVVVEKAIKDMNAYFPASREAKVLRTQVIKERKATILIAPGMAPLRPGVKTKWSNLYLAGDWIDTGLPATIESAVKSGFQAVEAISQLQH